MDTSVPELHEIDVSLKDDNIITFRGRRRLTHGSGGFGYTALAKGERQVVLKHIPMGDSDPDLLMREADNLKRLAYHRHIMRFYNVMQVANLDGEIELVLELEYCRGGTLRQEIIKRQELGQFFAPEQVRSWMIQLGRAVNYMHELAIAHRDIKPENILLTKDRLIKLGDFGLSKLIGEIVSKTFGFIGTLEYMAPEKFVPAMRANLDKGILELLNDVWSTGVVGFELAALRRPYIVQRSETGLRKHTAYVTYFTKEPQLSGEPLADEPWATCGHKHLVERMIAYRSQDRPNMASLIQEPYFTDKIPASVPDQETDKLHQRYIERGQKIADLKQENEKLNAELKRSQQQRGAEQQNLFAELTKELDEMKTTAFAFIRQSCKLQGELEKMQQEVQGIRKQSQS